MTRTLFAAAMLCVVACSPARAFSLFGSGDLVGQARLYLGKTARDLGLPRSDWCADFINMLLGRKHASRRARDYAHYGAPASEGCIGCIAVLSRGRSRAKGHVGVVVQWHGKNPVVISGNHNRVVGEGEYPHSRLVALRRPVK